MSRALLLLVAVKQLFLTASFFSWWDKRKYLDICGLYLPELTIGKLPVWPPV